VISERKEGTVPWEKKAPRKGTQLLVDAPVLDSARAVAVVANCSVADVWREAIDLHPQQEQHATELNELEVLLRELNVDTSKALEWMIRWSVNYSDLRGSQEAQGELVKAAGTAQS
jgi:hypothetical protein